ncbi:uncharacterized protein LOC128921983 isoform X2 [Zeugodacus cucurbitae]|uniref:uncharacterized protein LOC128921983 isoform X2 n=1 Tax=Zeugodacus cucurbitae TaxID=28588 RepID=UPI0023D91BDB|nr:uncharacterized protein LOC128921983 isoform X2 [Zeugodacus cucurbitae]
MAVLPGLCPPNWTNNNTIDCINATMDNAVGIGGTSASFTGFPGQDGAVMGYDGNYSLPRNGLFEFEMDPLERVVSQLCPCFSASSDLRACWDMRSSFWMNNYF